MSNFTDIECPGDEYLHFGSCTCEETILFSGWKILNCGGLVGSCFAVFFMAMFYEALKVGRELLLLRQSVSEVRYHSQQPNETILSFRKHRGEDRERVPILSWGHVIQTLLHVVQVTLSYFLMLIFMTYNGYLCMAVVLGAGVGYFVFGWKKAIVVDINEHCH